MAGVAVPEGRDLARRHERSDEPWEMIRELLPGRATDPGRTAADNRRLVDAVRSVARTGLPRADRPERLGTPNRAGRRFDGGCGAGVWGRLAGVLGDAGLSEPRLDSTPVKARPPAAPGRRRAGGTRARPTTAGASAGAGAG